MSEINPIINDEENYPGECADIINPIYLGCICTNGTWRITIVDNKFTIQLRVDGEYITKSEILP